MDIENGEAITPSSVTNATENKSLEDANMDIQSEKPTNKEVTDTVKPLNKNNNKQKGINQKKAKEKTKTPDTKTGEDNDKISQKKAKGNKCKTVDTRGDDKDADKEIKISLKYKKRPGTSAVVGALYKSHLLSIMLHRSLKAKLEFVLGCSVDDIGSMNEVCYRFHHNDQEKPIVVFIKTKFSGNIADNDLNNPKSACSLYNCFQSFRLIKETFDKEGNRLFEGRFDNITPYFVIYTPNQSKVGVVVSDNDTIFTDKVHDIIKADSDKIFKVQSENLVNDLICEQIEYIGKTIAAYVTSDIGDLGEISDEMKRILIKYYNFLIPDIIEINEPDDNYGVFNVSVLKTCDNFVIKLLKDVLIKEILKESKVNEDEARNNIEALETNCTANNLSVLIGNVLTYNEYTKKLAYMPTVVDRFNTISLDNIHVNKLLVDEAFEIAGDNVLNRTKIYFKNNDIIAEVDANEERTLERFFKDEKEAADQFLSYLYIYAEQKVDDVARRLKEDIFVYKVQKWMLLTIDSYYLTNKTCYFLDDTTNTVDHLSVLHYNCIIELQSNSIKFTKESTYTLSNINSQSSRTNIITNDVLLTSIKLLQFTADKSCLFFNFEDVYIMNDLKFQMLIRVVNEATLNTLVVIYEKEKSNNNMINQMVDGISKNIVLISKSPFEGFDTIIDEVKGLADIDINELLDYKITVQGHECELGDIMNENTKNAVNAKVLAIIIKHEKIELGRSLSNPFYDELHDCFIDRKISKYEHDDPLSVIPSCYHVNEFQINSFQDVDDKVILITAEPGMGKSTLLTHLSVKMKISNPTTWIVRVNLLNCCKDFFNWQKAGAVIDTIKSMRLICKLELNNEKIDKLFTLHENPTGDLVFMNKEKGKVEDRDIDIASLHMKLLIHSFNEGNIIFLFDGFDEICPHYEDVALQFISKLAGINSKSQQTWITCRRYNKIIEKLEYTLNIESFLMRRVTTIEQYKFYQRYWESRIKLENLNDKQFDNVEAFFEYMNQYRQAYILIFRIPTTSSVPLRLMHEAAVGFFRANVILSKLKYDDKQTLLNKWISIKTMQRIDDCFFTDEDYQEALQLAGIPLHMKIYADMFVSEIIGTSTTKNWEMGVHTFGFYNRYLEIKLKKIRFAEKGGENISTSAFLTEYEDLLVEFSEEHKKLAFYAFFHSTSKRFRKVLKKTQWLDMKVIMARIKQANEKTGLIDRIHKGEPRFVHLVFAEYYAVEFLADMLKAEAKTKNQVKRQIDFVINCLLQGSLGLMTAFNHKLKNDEELRLALEKDDRRKIIFNIWLEQHGKKKKVRAYYGIEEINIESSLDKVLDHGLKEAAWFMIKSIKDNLNASNVDNFIDFINKWFFKVAYKFDDMIKYVLDIINDVDSSMVLKVFKLCDFKGEIDLNYESFLSFLRSEDKSAEGIQYYGFDD